MAMLAKIALGNVRKSLRDFSVFFLTLVFGVCVFYAFNSITSQTAVLDLNELQSESVNTILNALSGISFFVVVILGFLVVYANQFLVRRRKREFGIYLTLGMSRGQVSRIMVIESLAVGLAALAVGLLLGVLVSQVMMYVTAHFFQATIPGFTFVFSPRAASATVACFAVIFAVSLVLNVASVSRYKLIDLINADKVSEKVTVRSLPISVVLFLVSLVLMGTAYWVLIKNGIMSDKFGLATGLVTVGTALFFYSVSGFLLRFVQTRPKFYLRGLNAFVLRQFNSRVNTAWVSITFVCAMLFVAICGVCTGLSVGIGFNDAVKKGSPYDATLETYLLPDADGHIENAEEAAADGFDMAEGMRRRTSEWDRLVARSAQLDAYYPDVEQGGLTAQWAWQTTDFDGGALFSQGMGGSGSTPFPFVRLSQYNALRELNGEKPVELGEHECLLWNDVTALDDFWHAFVEQHPSIQALGIELHPAGFAGETLYNTSSGSIMGGLVVNDSDIPADLDPLTLYLNVEFAGSRDEVGDAFNAMCAEVLGPENSRSSFQWPAGMVQGGREMADASVGLTVVTSYLAIYIGFVLLITCASVLAIQQLSGTADNVGRYRVLFELGAEPSMVRHALMVQIGVYFVFPLVVAVCHAACALTTINDVVALTVGYDISNALLATVAFVVVLYGGYFIVTYETSKGMILRPAMR